MKFHNCQNGIYIEQGNAVFTMPVYFSNISEIALQANKNSSIYHAGPSGGSGGHTGSFRISNATIGVHVSNNSTLDATNAEIKDVRYGLVGSKNASVKLTSSLVQAKNITGYEMIGVYADSLAQISAFDVSCTGFSGNTGTTGTAQFRVVNKALLFVESLTQSNHAAVGDGTVVVDPSRGLPLVNLGPGQYSYNAPSGGPTLG